MHPMAGTMGRGLKENIRDRWNELAMSSNPLQLDLFAYDPSLTSTFGRRVLQANSPAPAFTLPPAPPPRGNPTGFATPDPIVVIILGVLLFALICAAFLNSILRCLLRRRRLRAWRAAAEAHAANGHGGIGGFGPGGDGSASVAHGLDPKILHSLPILEFLKNESSSVPDTRAGDCSICLSEFSEKEKLRLLPKCSHIFHLDCIDMWLQSHASCPVCRDTVADGGAPLTQGQAMLLRPGSSVVGAGAAASTAGPESDLMLLIQDENGHSVAAPGSMRRDARSFRLVAANPTGGVGGGSSRRAVIPELPTTGGQQDQQQMQLVPLERSDAEAANSSSLRSTGSKTYLVFEAGYFFSGRWLASSSSSSLSASAVTSSDSATGGATSGAATTGEAVAPSSTVTHGTAGDANSRSETPTGTSTSK